MPDRLNKLFYGVICLLLISPLLYSCILSFSCFENSRLLRFGTFLNYKDLFYTIPMNIMRKAIFRSLIIAGSATLFSLLLVYLFVRFVYFYVLRLFIIAVSLQFLINEAPRIFSYKDLLRSSENSVYIMCLVSSLPFAVLILLTYSSRISSNTWAASRDLGTPIVREFFQIFCSLNRIGVLLSFLMLFLVNLSFSSEIIYFSGASKNSISKIIEEYGSSNNIAEIIALGNILFLAHACIFILIRFLLIKKYNYASQI